MNGGRLYVVCYDFPSDKHGNRRRYRVVKFLTGQGHRVQESVFELRVEKKEDMEKIIKKLESMIRPKLDSIRFYPIHSDIEREIQILGLGEVYKIEDAYFF